MLNSKIQKIEKSKTQFGLVATKVIAAGELVWAAHESDPNLQVTLSWQEIENLPEEKRNVFLWFAYQVARNQFSGYTQLEDVLGDDSNFINHSCDPNVWYDSQLWVARKNIEVGQEITYDYGTDAVDRDWDFICNCGAKDCRGKVTRNDWKVLQFKYPGHLSPFVEEMIQNLAADKAEDRAEDRVSVF